MTPKQQKLIENYIRLKVKKVLNETPENRDLEYLYRILKTSAPKIKKSLSNVVVNGNRNDPTFKDILAIERAWNDFIFGVSDYYHNKIKK